MDTQFEVSCYTDPLALEHLTGALTASMRFFAGWDAATGLRFTTKFAAVEPLLEVQHGRRTRVRFSVNAEAVAGRFEGGTASLAERLVALRRLALAGYPVGLTFAPSCPSRTGRPHTGDCLTMRPQPSQGYRSWT